MTDQSNRLEDDVLAAFQRACQEQDLLVAEHLLRTLEVIAERQGSEEQIHDVLRYFASTLPQRPWHS